MCKTAGQQQFVFSSWSILVDYWRGYDGSV